MNPVEVRTDLVVAARNDLFVAAVRSKSIKINYGLEIYIPALAKVVDHGINDSEIIVPEILKSFRIHF